MPSIAAVLQGIEDQVKGLGFQVVSQIPDAPPRQGIVAIGLTDGPLEQHNVTGAWDATLNIDLQVRIPYRKGDHSILAARTLDSLIRHLRTPIQGVRTQRPQNIAMQTQNDIHMGTLTLVVTFEHE